MDVATISLQDTGIRKAAILMASLDQAAADLLLHQLGPERADLVRQAVMYLDKIDPAERQRIVDEFRRIGPMVPGQSPSGIELDKMPARPVGKNRVSATPSATGCEGTFDSSVAADAAPPFHFLHDAEDEKLANLLGSERPPTVALVLSHLPPERAGEVLACLPAAQQVEVVRRLVDLEKTDSESLREIERAIEARWSRQFETDRRRAAGPDAVAKILAACDPQTRGQILDNLAAHDQPLAEQLGDRPIAFEELARLSDAKLLAIYRAAEPEVALAALLGTPPAVVERLLRRMSDGDAKRLRRKLAHPGPIRLSDIEEARQQIAALAQRMLRDNPERHAA